MASAQPTAEATGTMQPKAKNTRAQTKATRTSSVQAPDALVSQTPGIQSQPDDALVSKPPGIQSQPDVAPVSGTQGEAQTGAQTGEKPATRAQATPVSGAQAAIDFINLQIAKLTDGLASSVLAVSSAFSMHVEEIADAYSGRCPDHSTDVEPLDLDQHYVVLLDNLRRTRPSGYQLLVNGVHYWQNHVPALYEQPHKMSVLANLVVSLLNKLDGGPCSTDVEVAVAASLLSAKSPPPLDVANTTADSDADNSAA